MIMRSKVPKVIDAKLFMKLPPKFLIPTPIGDYNPDRAILKKENGQRKIYMISETRSTPEDELLRPTEAAKIECGKKHFAHICINSYTNTSPVSWIRQSTSLHRVTSESKNE